MTLKAAELAEKKINHARWLAETNFLPHPGIAEHDLLRAGAAIRGVYDKLVPSWMTHWANYSKETPLAHQLLLGPPAIVDLDPDQDDDEFKIKTKGRGADEHTVSLSIAEVTALAEHGAVIPNVYVRNVKKWERAPYASQYEAILNLPNCIANGEITAPDTQSALIETLAAASANNFGYLRVLGPDYLYRGIEEHLETPNAERIVEAFGVIRASKHVFASPLTAALGGLFICPNFAEVIRNLFIRPEHSDQAMDRIEQLRKQAPLLQFLYERVSHIHRQEYQTLAGAAPPLAVLVTKDFRQRTQMIWEMQRAIARSFAQDGKVEEPKLDDLRCLYQDRARMITSVHTTVETIGGNLEKPIQIAHAMGELLHWCTFGHPTGHSYVQDGTLDFAEAAALEASRMADLAAAITFHWPGDRSLFYRRTVQLEELARS